MQDYKEKLKPSYQKKQQPMQKEITGELESTSSKPVQETVETLKLEKEQLQKQLAEQTEHAKQVMTFAQKNIKEKLAEQIHEELVLQSKLEKLEYTNENQNKLIEQLTRKLANLEVKRQTLVAEKQQLQTQLRCEEVLIQQVKAAKTELADYKLKFVTLVDVEKEPFIDIQKENEEQLKMLGQQERELVSLRAERDYFKDRYNQIMQTRIMKWIGKYWLIRKRLRSKK
ncbi:hypothetical protein HCB69_13770 [Listeria booriae]|uniref:Uncharacterized protein n=1 Tax=Listeria booriae TaxID=1552123 RepID=A0A842FLC6_9LIST|nr:hypothetical protein [Listeria booriae]MBC2285452.1 hypothetical protein [Listeria booriae]MBC2292351.1 hypothetical protein [Listeria booriae]